MKRRRINAANFSSTKRVANYLLKCRVVLTLLQSRSRSTTTLSDMTTVKPEKLQFFFNKK